MLAFAVCFGNRLRNPYLHWAGEIFELTHDVHSLITEHKKKWEWLCVNRP